ncbi:MAG: type II toxin-antitoxin system VapC family toxin [Anaerolineales bacterium]
MKRAVRERSAPGRQSLTLVIDASAGIKLFISEPLSDRAEALFDRLKSDPSTLFYVPDLFFVECANILWKYVRRFGYPAENASQDVADLRRLRLRSVSTADLITDAFSIGLRHSLTLYDSSYVALAQRLAAPLITADERLAQTLPGPEFNVRWLGDYSLPWPPEAT